MITTRTTILGIAVLLGSSAISQDATASHGSIARSAARIENSSGLLNQEFRLHFAHVPGYRQLLAHSKYIFLRAQHIRVLAYHGGSPHAMANDIEFADRSYHDLQHVLHKMELLVNQGQLPLHGRVAHVHVLMSRLARDLHGLQAEIAALVRHCRTGHVVYYAQPARTVKKKPARNYGEVRSGWTRTLSNLEGSRSRGNDKSRRSLSSRRP